MNHDLENEKGRRYARALYTQLGRTIRETALEAGEDEGDIRNWINEGEWDLVRKSSAITNKHLVDCYYDVAAELNARIMEKPEKNPKDLDQLQKYANIIKTMESESSVYSLIGAAQQFITWLYYRDMPLAQTVTRQFDAFIKERKAA